jgi:hypothetical protein
MTLKYTCRLLLAAVAVLALATAVNAASIPIFNTGVNGGGTVLPDGTVGDPHYVLTAVPTGSTANIRIRTSAGGYPIPPYIGDDSLSAWIGPNNDTQVDGPVGAFDYLTTFNLAGLNPSTASLTISWSTDNGGLDVLLNGASLGQTTSPIQYGLGFSTFTVSSGFISGINTLDFLVQNDGGPTALRVEASGIAAPTPEPGTLALLSSGVLGLFGVLRRKLML